MARQTARRALVLWSLAGTTAAAVVLAAPADAKQNLKTAFFQVYGDAEGTVLDTVPSQPDHCGLCHLDFAGGGTLNAYGQLLEFELPNWPNNPNGRRQAIMAIATVDADGDGYSTEVEVTDLGGFANTPTFPGLTPDTAVNATNVDLAEIGGHLIPSTSDDTTPPEVVVLSPSGGTLIANAPALVEWTASDEGGVAFVSILLSDDGGATFAPIALGLSNEGTHTWYPPNRPTSQAVIRVEARDTAFNVGHDDSVAFTVASPPGGLAPTTLRDFDMPGTQPLEAGTLNPPEGCFCHGFYDPPVEPQFNWLGGMMSQASTDPLFLAAMAIANQDAPDSGDLCLRCHMPRGWLGGRSVPTDGSQLEPGDLVGVACDLCHRLVDPIYDPQVSPPEDEPILAALGAPVEEIANGTYVVDPTGTARRGPFDDAVPEHPVIVSPFHREAAVCGICHDVSNPAFETDGQGGYLPNGFDEPASSISSEVLAPVERTYSEWLHSNYNTPDGVYAPQFGGNRDFVATCQDCHMRDVTGRGCIYEQAPIRDDLPLHDMTGGSTWLAALMPLVNPGADPFALDAGVERARYMLQNAAGLSAAQEEQSLVVTVVNETGHKLPTGYPEGRRMWLNVRFYDDAMALVGESGAYDPESAAIEQDEQLKVYEIELGMDENVAPLADVEPGPSFHFVLNNKTFKDNRIPPRGFTNAAYAQFGGAPVGAEYADGQYWDDTTYAIPPGAAQAEVTLYYQSTRRELVEFLRDENVTNGAGQSMYDLWDQNGRCPPEPMATVTLPVDAPPLPCPADVDGSGVVEVDDLLDVILAWGACGVPEGCAADVDGSGFVDVDDLVAVILAWGPCDL